MLEQQYKVLQFHKKFQCAIAINPELPDNETRVLRQKLILEELIEFCDATTVVDAVDAIGDLLYVVFGAAVSFGIDIEKAFDEIHFSNMSKLWTTAEVNEAQQQIKLGSFPNPADISFTKTCDGHCGITHTRCYCVKTSYGKVIKSPSYSKPEIDRVLNGIRV